MKHGIVAITSVAMLILIGCATPKMLQAVGGSRADGTVDLAYEYGLFEEPQVDVAGAASTAAERCAVWGYSGAEPFGGGREQCLQRNGYGNCLRAVVTVTYQCTGSPGPMAP
jgi:hypothetical protein